MKPNAKIEIEVFDNRCIKVGMEGQFTDLTIGFCAGVAQVVQLASKNANKTPEELLNIVTAEMRNALGSVLSEKGKITH